MKNIVEWLVQFKVEQNAFQAAARKVKNGLDEIGRKADRVSSKIEAAFSGKNFKQALQGLPVISSLMNPYVAAITGIGAGLTAIVKVGSEAEKTAIAFGTLVGNEEKAAAMLKDIKQFANYTPYETMDLVNSAQTMLSFGVATDTTTEKLKQLGDISRGDANILKSLSLVYGQVSSLGYMQGQDWHQFINAGFNPLQELSEMTGKTMGELQEMMSKGQIGVRAINAAIEHATSEGGKFYEMSKKQAESVQGRWSTLVGKINEGLAQLFEYLKPVINWLIDAVPPFFDFVISHISGMAQMTKKFINDFSPFISLLKKVGYYAMEFGKILYKWVYGQLEKILNAVGLVGNALARLFGIKGEKTTTTGAQKTKKTVEKTAPKNQKKYGLDIFEKPKFGGKGGKGANGKDANAIATGGTRNTTITMNIGKFFDTMQVTMMDSTDTTELETIVVQSLNRALAIATSTDR